jgi:MFS family permease
VVEGDEVVSTRGAGRQLWWAAMAVLVASYLLTFVVRYGTAVVVPELRADLGVGDAALGALAAAYFWPYALMQPVAGLLADAWGARRAVPLFVALAALGTALFAAAPSFPLALVGRALGGAGVGIVYIGGISLLSRWVTTKRFGTAAGLFSASGILGGFVAARPLDALVERIGWRGAFGIIAALLLALAAGGAAVIPPVPRWERAGRAAPLQGLHDAVRLSNVWLIGAYAFVALGILSSMQGLWTVPYVTDVYGLGEAESAAVLEALSFGLFVAIPFWGLVADRVLRSPKRTILLSLVIQTAAWALLAAAPTAWPRGGLYVLFFVVGFSNGCWMPAYALVRSTSPAEVQATALGLLNFGFFVGAALFQQGSGVLLGQFARGKEEALPTSAYQALFTGFCGALVAAAVCVAVSREQTTPQGPWTDG